MLSVKKSITFILCLLFCIHYSISMRAQTFSQMKSLAESGNVEAQFYLGNLYENGKGLGIAYYKDITVKGHYNKAFYWLTKVAESRYAIEKSKASSLYWLQRCYRFGRGVAKDVNKANELVKQYSGYDSDEPSLIELLETKK